MPEFHYNDGTAWRKVKEYHYNDGTAWRKAKEIWYNDGTAWRLAFKAETVFFNSRTVAASGAALSGSATATAQIQFLSNGTLRSVTAGTGSNTVVTDYSNEWLQGSTAGSSYEVQATIVSGTVTSGTTGTWLSLASNNTWSATQTVSSGVLTKTVVLTFQVRDVASNTVQASNNITLTATADRSG